MWLDINCALSGFLVFGDEKKGFFQLFKNLWLKVFQEHQQEK